MVSREFSGVQAVSMLKAFNVGEPIGSECLVYPNLATVAEEAKSKQYDLLDDFWWALPGSIEEEKFARSAAIGYLVLTAYQLQNVNPASQPLISRRFTDSSVEIYGVPEADLAKQLLIAQHEFFGQINGEAVDRSRLNNLNRTLEQALGDLPEAKTQPEDFSEIAEQLRGLINARYGQVLNVFNQQEEGGKLTLDQTQSLMQQALDELAQTDPDWEDFTSELVNDSGMSASYIQRKVKIGKRGNYEPQRLKPLFAHEVLGHLLRSINGAKTGNMLMAKGLPGNVDIEEGLCILLEYAVSGQVADKVTDRYIDTALALGLTGLPPVNRAQLHQLHSNRLIVRAQAAGQDVDIDKIERAAWNHVDRIYRGSLGNEIVGVNTKDIAYYKGFITVANYIKTELDRGQTIDAIYDYIMCGCFNPTNERHREFVASLIQ